MDSKNLLKADRLKREIVERMGHLAEIVASEIEDITEILVSVTVCPDGYASVSLSGDIKDQRRTLGCCSRIRGKELRIDRAFAELRNNADEIRTGGKTIYEKATEAVVNQIEDK